MKLSTRHNNRRAQKGENAKKQVEGEVPHGPPTGSSMTVKWSDNFEDMWKLGTKLGSSSEYVTRD